MKISIITHSLSDNCLGRAWLLAKVLQRRYEVELIGTVFSRGIWMPLANEFDYKTSEGSSFPRFILTVRDMLKKITGDVIYSVKPYLASYGTALFKHILTHRPVVLDIDDWDMAIYAETNWWLLSKKFLVGNPNSPLYNAVMEKLIPLANGVTVSSSFLKRKFGGIIVPHGRDTAIFDPESFDGHYLRQDLSLDDDKIIMFLGTPRPPKGLEDIITAIKILNESNLKLVVIGADPEGTYEKRLAAQGGNQVVLVGKRPFHQVPEFLSIAGLVVLPQRNTKFSHAQVPAKVFDAMAMAKPIIATNVSDLPEILDGCGWIVEPENPEKLAEAIRYVFDHPKEAKEMGWKAREKCIKKYSWNAMEKTLTKIFGRYE